ncbi:MAG: response regulator transcription factor [Anaerolineae bacterium]|jgi:DNA-binding response OmpR family regulator
MKQQFRVLVIDDNREMLEMMEVMLGHEGFHVVAAADPLTGLRAVYQEHPDAVVLDVMMPQMDGFEVCRRIRELTDVPVLLYTGKAREPEDVVHGFSVGADDYLVKPFRPSELVSRLFARLRSSSESRTEARAYVSPDASIILNVDRRELTLKDETIYLPPKEFKVLEVLLRHAGQVISTNAILLQVWGPDHVGQTDLVKQCVYRLRKKIELDPGMPRLIHSVRSEGYYFEINSS